MLKLYRNLPHSLISIGDVSDEVVQQLFKRAEQLRGVFAKRTLTEEDGTSFRFLHRKVVLNCFFEPSTRTRVSFEMAAKKLGTSVINVDADFTSIKKGETIFDTLKNLEAMEPDLVVIRHRESGMPERASRILKTHIINGGDGTHEHPTQALLDTYSLWRRFGLEGLKGLKLSIVGDIAHSRVACSDIQLFKRFGIDLLLCAPPLFLSSKFGRVFDVPVEYNFERAIKMADVVLFLRIQKERHKESSRFYPYLQYQLNRRTYALAEKKPWIMHPGPINWGVEMEGNFINHEKSLVLEQVNNGLYIRMALLEAFLQSDDRMRRLDF